MNDVVDNVVVVWEHAKLTSAVSVLWTYYTVNLCLKIPILCSKID